MGMDVTQTRVGMEGSDLYDLNKSRRQIWNSEAIEGFLSSCLGTGLFIYIYAGDV